MAASAREVAESAVDRAHQQTREAFPPGSYGGNLLRSCGTWAELRLRLLDQVQHALREYAARILDDLASQAEIAADYADDRRSARETWLEVRDDLRRRAEEERRG